MSSLISLPRPRWYSIPPRVLVFTLLLTLLGFAIALLLSILAVVIAAQLHGARPNFQLAYRTVALPIAVVAGSISFVVALVMEVRYYRHAKALAEIARASQ